MANRNTRRILVLSAPLTPVSAVLKSLLASEAPDPSAIAGQELHHHIKTAYYEAKISLWVDTVESPNDWSLMWKEMEGAKEVVEAVGAWIAVFEKPVSKSDLDSIAGLLDSISSTIRYYTEYSSYDTVRLAVALPPGTREALLEVSSEDLEDACSADDPSESWELVDATALSGTNEYGEKQGLDRLIEALQTAEWDVDDEAGLETNGEIGLSERQQHNLEPSSQMDHSRTMRADPMLEGLPLDGQEVPILAAAARSGGTKEEEEEEDEVETLQRMLVRLQAARDMGADLPESERKRLAAEAVREVMDEL